MIHIAPYIDKILEVLAEYGSVHSSLGREQFRLTVGMSHHHLLVCRTVGIGSEIGVTRLFVIAIHGCHHIVLLHNLALQLSVQVIEIQMVIAIALTRQQDMLVCDLHIRQHVFLDILVHLVLDGQLAHRRERIGHIDTEHVLMAVHGEDGNLRRITGSLDARDIAVGIEWQVDLPRLVRLDVITQHAHLRVHLSRHRILIGVVAWIFRKLLSLRNKTLEQLHRILLYGTFVIAYPHDLL